jgi:hypothetical protein
MRARAFLASYASPSGTRKVPIQFFAASQKDALRIARKKAGKGLLFGLSLAQVGPLSPDLLSPGAGADGSTEHRKAA